jgi:multicomponent Na+:H+ antiporter subunit D
MTPAMHPAWPLLAAAALAALLPPGGRRVVALAGPAAALALAWALPIGTQAETARLGDTLTWARVDALGRSFAVVFALIAGLGALYAWATPRRGLFVGALVSAAAAQGIVLAGDWVTLYVAWEALAVASFVLVIDGGRPASWRAGLRYLLVHLVGGGLLLGGIAWHRGTGNDPLVGPLGVAGAGWLVLLGFAVNAAIPPLHGWLTDAYPESSPAAGVFLSAFATKSAVYALARVFPGEELLVVAGVTMALYGVVFAVLENDVRRLLGYHIVSQVGYMVTGVGLGSPIAISGAAAHAFAHILYKGLLFMGAGAVIHATGRRRLSDLGGLAPAMPWTVVLYMVGALSISGAPLLNGFVSKSLVVQGAHEAHREAVAWLLTLASVGTFLSVGLKLPWLAFGGPPRGLRPEPVPRAMLAAMAATAALCALTGVVPGLLYALLPFAIDYAPYTRAHVLEALQLLAGTLVGFVLLREALRGGATVTLDVDRAYRALGRLVLVGLAAPAARLATAMEALADDLVDRPVAVAARLPRPVGYAVLVVVTALGLTLAAMRMVP